MSSALVTARDAAMPVLPVRLRWRGLEVSDEFQAYAERVARGEELAPFRGALLARRCPEFPWQTFQARETTERLPPVSSRSLRNAAWLFGIAGAMLAAIGIATGAASGPADDGFAALESSRRSLRPGAEEGAPPAAGQEELERNASLLSDVEEWAPSSAAPGAPRRTVDARPGMLAAGGVSATTRVLATAAGAAAGGGVASSATSQVRAASEHEGTAAPPSPAVDAPRTAAPEAVADDEFGLAESMATADSALFSDQPPF